jgi:hypothetical protein
MSAPITIAAKRLVRISADLILASAYDAWLKPGLSSVNDRARSPDVFMNRN